MKYYTRYIARCCRRPLSPVGGVVVAAVKHDVEASHRRAASLVVLLRHLPRRQDALYLRHLGHQRG